MTGEIWRDVPSLPSPNLTPDRDQIEIFVDGLFRHASLQGFVSLRAFYEGDAIKPFRINPTSLSGGLPFLIEVAFDDANRAAAYPRPVVFCPPVAVFSIREHARESDIAEGLALSVECDERAREARSKLEALLGPATMVVRSGGKWTDPATGEIEDKLHGHWRLRTPARGKDIAKLKQARDLATRLVGGDPSNKPVCHPIRWPGSWHRKGEPVLCSIDTASPDAEVDLDSALTMLIAKCPAAPDTGSIGTGVALPASHWRHVLAGPIMDGSRNRTMTSVTGHLLAHEIDPLVTLAIMQSLNATHCVPPLPTAKVEGIVASICGRELRKRGNHGA